MPQPMKRTRGAKSTGSQITQRLWTGDRATRDLLTTKDADLEGVLLQHPRIADSIIKAEDDGNERRRRFRISTETRDRHGDVVRSRGLKLNNYRKNPVVLFAHDASAPPIGKAAKVDVGDGTVDADVDFLERDVFEFADTIFRIVEVGGLKATSIGFMPLDFARLENDDGEEMDGIDFKKSDLLEFSVVPVPANPEAVARCASDGYDMKPYLRWLDDMQDNSDALESLFKDLGIEAGDLQAVRRAADGDKTIVTRSGSIVDQDGNEIDTRPMDEVPPEGEEINTDTVADVPPEQQDADGQDTEAKGPISYRQAHPNGTPAQDQDAEWDGPGEIAAAEVEDLLVMSAWRADKDRDELNKSDFKLPHHKASGNHAVNFRGATAAIAALNGARGGVDIPDDDKRGVYNHLARHIREDFDEVPPELRWIDVQPLKHFAELFVFDYERCSLLTWIDNGLVDVNMLDFDWDGRSEGETPLLKSLPDEVDKQTFTIQSIAGNKNKWKSRQAFLDWAKEHDFRTDKVDSTQNYWRLRQQDPEDFERLRTLCINPNDVGPNSQDCRVQAVGGPMKEAGAADGDDRLMALAYQTAAAARSRDIRDGVYGRDLGEDAVNRLCRFEGFFQVTGGTAMDIGDTEPNECRPLDGAPTFARIIEDRNFDANKAKDLGAVSREDAETGARQIAEAHQDADLMIIIGESVGTYNEAPLYRDCVAWRWVPERGGAVRIPLGAELTDPVQQLCELAETVHKAGRVLSQANETRLRQALELLSSVLEQLGSQDPDEGDDKSLDLESDDDILDQLLAEAGVETTEFDNPGDTALDDDQLDKAVDGDDFTPIITELVKGTMADAVRNSAREEISKVTGTVD